MGMSDSEEARVRRRRFVFSCPATCVCVSRVRAVREAQGAQGGVGANPHQSEGFSHI